VRNRAWYLGNRFTFDRSFAIGADYLRWITDYQSLKRGADRTTPWEQRIYSSTGENDRQEAASTKTGAETPVQSA
jgi:hypothetical protein